jgi:hypothetical protein
MKLDTLMKGGAAAFKKHFLHNYIVLYIIVFIAFFNLVSYAIYGNYVTIAIFCMVAILTSFFSKNMIVIFTLGLAVANLLTLGPKAMQVEGMAVQEEEESDEESNEENEKDKDTFKDKVDSDQDTNISSKLNVENPIPSTEKRESKMNLKQYRDRKKEFDFIKNKYAEVLKIQEQIMNNVGSLEGSMSDMDKLVDDVKKNLNTIRDTIPA